MKSKVFNVLLILLEKKEGLLTFVSSLLGDETGRHTLRSRG
jgi:hypothetical protein